MVRGLRPGCVPVPHPHLPKEKLRLDFRPEAFNLPHRVRFGTGSSSLQSPNFGKLTGANDLLDSPRQMPSRLNLYWQARGPWAGFGRRRPQGQSPYTMSIGPPNQ